VERDKQNIGRDCQFPTKKKADQIISEDGGAHVLRGELYHALLIIIVTIVAGIFTNDIQMMI
jgi:hypothetical protein